MELHLALKNIVNLSGTSILKEQRLVNILADFNAYYDEPSFKFLIKTIIDEGYMEKLLANGKWDLNCEKLIDQFAAMTGIVKDNVSYAFEGLGYALGWKNVMAVDRTSPLGNSKIYIDDKTYLTSIVEVRNGASLTGIVLSNPSVGIRADDKLMVGCEVSGKLKRNSYKYLQIRCSVYVEGHINFSCMLGNYINSDNFSGFTIVSEVINVSVPLRNITRIVMYIG